MQKMWSGRTNGATAKLADDFNSSISFDSRMYKQDITGSMAHAAMLGQQGIISAADAEAIIEGLTGILEDLESGKITVDPEAEDIHMYVEQLLTERIGDAGKKVHTARSRNDQVALDMRLYVRDEIAQIQQLLLDMLRTLTEKAKANINVIMPGFTHMQHAQPVLFSFHMMAYAMMFARDYDRLTDCLKRVNVSPIGCCALAGTTYDTDRKMEAAKLGFDAVALNSMDGVSDRDYCVELLAILSTVMMHLSRFSEEVILWSSSEFGFVELSDNYTTGSSIMPQKKNPDMAELTRGKTGRVYGDLMGLLTTLKGIPLTYNKDMQEDKEGVYDAIDTVKMCLGVFTPMIAEANIKADAMYAAAQKGFMNATDLADYLTKKGMPFRDAYKISGKMVHLCIEKGCILETLPLEEYKTFSELFENDVYEAISLETCVSRRTSYGGTSRENVEMQIAFIEENYL